MIFISGIISIIIQENTLGKNKLRVIYFCRNCVSFFAHFFGQTKTKCKKKKSIGFPSQRLLQTKQSAKYVQLQTKPSMNILPQVQLPFILFLKDTSRRLKFSDDKGKISFKQNNHCKPQILCNFCENRLLLEIQRRLPI